MLVWIVAPSPAKSWSATSRTCWSRSSRWVVPGLWRLLKSAVRYVNRW